MTMQRMNQLQSMCEQISIIANDAANRYDGCHNQWVAVIKMLEDAGVTTEEDYRKAFQTHIAQPELDRQRNIMESHNVRHKDGTGCPIKCKARQDPPENNNFDPTRCQFLWESCPAGYNPKASKPVQPNPPGAEEMAEKTAQAEEATVDDVLAEAAENSQEPADPGAESPIITP